MFACRMGEEIEEKMKMVREEIREREKRKMKSRCEGAWVWLILYRTGLEGDRISWRRVAWFGRQTIMSPRKHRCQSNKCKKLE